MGGAGTSVPPVLVELPPELLDELEEELLDDVDELVLPKLDELEEPPDELEELLPLLPLDP